MHCIDRRLYNSVATFKKCASCSTLRTLYINILHKPQVQPCSYTPELRLIWYSTLLNCELNCSLCDICKFFTMTNNLLHSSQFMFTVSLLWNYGEWTATSIFGFLNDIGNACDAIITSWIRMRSQWIFCTMPNSQYKLVFFDSTMLNMFVSYFFQHRRACWNRLFINVKCRRETMFYLLYFKKIYGTYRYSSKVDLYRTTFSIQNVMFVGTCQLTYRVLNWSSNFLVFIHFPRTYFSLLQ